MAVVDVHAKHKEDWTVRYGRLPVVVVVLSITSPIEKGWRVASSAQFYIATNLEIYLARDH